MWARVVEFMLACWLAVSPFVFGHGERTFLWVNDFACAALIATFSLASFVRPRLHLGNLAVALWLVVAVFVGADAPPSPARQNHMVFGLLLGMVAIVPSHASTPPTAWIEYNRRKGGE